MYVCKFVSSLLYSCFRNCFKKIHTAHHHCVEWISTDRTQYQFRSSYATTFSLALFSLYLYWNACIVLKLPNNSPTAFLVCFYCSVLFWSPYSRSLRSYRWAHDWLHLPQSLNANSGQDIPPTEEQTADATAMNPPDSLPFELRRRSRWGHGISKTVEIAVIVVVSNWVAWLSTHNNQNKAKV